jgi:uncharacterized protein
MTETKQPSVAERFVQAIEGADENSLADLLADNVTCWRNLDERSLSKQKMLKVISFLHSRLSNLRYEDVRILHTEHGYVQQHRLCGETSDGTAVRACACLVVTVEGDRIVRLEEYLDSKAILPLLS